MTSKQLSRLVTASLAGLLLLGATGSASAGRLEERTVAQRDRIEQALRAGRLAPMQARRLRAREARIMRDLERARVRMRGHLTPRQRAHFARRTANLARDISHALRFSRRF